MPHHGSSYLSGGEVGVEVVHQGAAVEDWLRGPGPGPLGVRPAEGLHPERAARAAHTGLLQTDTLRWRNTSQSEGR